LTLDYVANSPAWLRETDTYEPRIIEAQYFHKLPQQMRRLERRVFQIKKDTGRQVLLDDKLLSFNGKATLRLLRAAEPNLMRASVYEGYKSEGFVYGDCPHDVIWKMGPRSYGAVIRESRDTFRIESDSELVERVPVIKIVGTVMDGKLIVRMWISPQRGFLPLKMQFVRASDNKLGREVVLSDLTRLPKGLWYPRRIREGSPDPKEATTYDLKKISTEPIAEEFFTPKIPPGTFVHDHVLGLTYTTEVGDADPGALGITGDASAVAPEKVLDQYVAKANEQESQGATGGSSMQGQSEPGVSSSEKGPPLGASDPDSGRARSVVLVLLVTGVLLALLAWAGWKKLGS